MSSRTLNASGWGDIFQLQAQIASWCPTREPNAEQLLSDVGARAALIRNVKYSHLGLVVELLTLMHQHLAKVQSDMFGFTLSPPESKLAADTASLATETVVVTYVLFQLCIALPKLSTHEQVEVAKAVQRQCVRKGATLPASMQKAVDSFAAGKGGAVDPPQKKTKV